MANELVSKSKAMISLPMNGKSEDDIYRDYERAKTYLEEHGFEVVNTLFTEEWYSPDAMAERGVVNTPLCFLAKSLVRMSLCDAVYFVKGWHDSRGCRIEHEAAVVYGLTLIYEDA